MKDKIQTTPLPQGVDTYGWSPDEVLYNIFDVVSTRNKFVAEDIANILDLLSNPKTGQPKLEPEVHEKLIYLQKTLRDIDPLKEVVKSILKKIN